MVNSTSLAEETFVISHLHFSGKKMSLSSIGVRTWPTAASLCSTIIDFWTNKTSEDVTTGSGQFLPPPTVL